MDVIPKLPRLAETEVRGEGKIPPKSLAFPGSGGTQGKIWRNYPPKGVNVDKADDSNSEYERSIIPAFGEFFFAPDELSHHWAILPVKADKPVAGRKGEGNAT